MNTGNTQFAQLTNRESLRDTPSVEKVLRRGKPVRRVEDRFRAHDYCRSAFWLDPARKMPACYAHVCAIA